MPEYFYCLKFFYVLPILHALLPKPPLANNDLFVSVVFSSSECHIVEIIEFVAFLEVSTSCYQSFHGLCLWVKCIKISPFSMSSGFPYILGVLCFCTTCRPLICVNFVKCVKFMSELIFFYIWIPIVTFVEGKLSFLYFIVFHPLQKTIGYI